MKLFKIIAILTFITSAVFAINSCNSLNCDRAHRYMTLRYNGFYTGIDTLIKNPGTFSIENNSDETFSINLSRNGTLMCYKIIRKVQLYFDISTKAIYFSGFYKIQNDTIITQIASNTAVDIYEVWFKILSKEKLLIIKFDRINNISNKKDCNNCKKYINKELVYFNYKKEFIPENWLLRCKELRE